MAKRAQTKQRLEELNALIERAHRKESQRAQKLAKISELQSLLERKARQKRQARATALAAARAQLQRVQAQRAPVAVARPRTQALPPWLQPPLQGAQLRNRIAIYNRPEVWAGIRPDIAQELWRQLIAGVRVPNYNGQHLPYPGIN